MLRKVILFLSSMAFVLSLMVIIFSYTSDRVFLNPEALHGQIHRSHLFDVLAEEVYDTVAETIHEEMSQAELEELRNPDHYLRYELLEIIKDQIDGELLYGLTESSKIQIWNYITDNYETKEEVSFRIDLVSISNKVKERMSERNRDNAEYLVLERRLYEKMDKALGGEMVLMSEDIFSGVNIQSYYSDFTETKQQWFWTAVLVLFSSFVLAYFYTLTAERTFNWLGDTLIRSSVSLLLPVFLYILGSFTPFLVRVSQRYFADVPDDLHVHFTYLLLNILRDFNGLLIIPMIFLFMVGLALKE